MLLHARCIAVLYTSYVSTRSFGDRFHVQKCGAEPRWKLIPDVNEMNTRNQTRPISNLVHRNPTSPAISKTTSLSFYSQRPQCPTPDRPSLVPAPAPDAPRQTSATSVSHPSPPNTKRAKATILLNHPFERLTMQKRMRHSPAHTLRTYRGSPRHPHLAFYRVAQAGDISAVV